MMGQVVLAVGERELRQVLRRAGPRLELDPERCADTPHPVGVADLREAMRAQGMAVTGEDEGDTVDDGAVEVEQHGADG